MRKYLIYSLCLLLLFGIWFELSLAEHHYHCHHENCEVCAIFHLFDSNFKLLFSALLLLLSFVLSDRGMVALNLESLAPSRTPICLKTRLNF